VKRREFLAALAAPALAAPALIGLARKTPRVIRGGFVDDGGTVGHELRDGRLRAFPGGAHRVPVVVVGAGIAGLSAAWELGRRSMSEFVVLELERDAGGNSRQGANHVTRFPWGAHYVPVPDARATLVRELFEELGVLREGTWDERHLCFSPQERLFQHGRWHEGVEPHDALDRGEQEVFRRFHEEMEVLRDSRQFTIPMERGAPRDSPLDHLSMAEWLSQRRLDAPALRWYVDYACRDDYGAPASDTSAWAGAHYFASRAEGELGPLTWPEGNGWLAQRLADRCAKQLRIGEPAVGVSRRGSRWEVRTPKAAYLADAVVWAAPTFVAPHLVDAFRGRRAPLEYSPWLVANLTLDRWPRDRGTGLGSGAPTSWDNVIYGSRSLGYVVATHQSLATHHEETVWTYYWALAEVSPRDGRALLQRRPWDEWRELILADLERAHPDIRDCVARVDIMRMGHAMVRPTAGFLTARRQLSMLTAPGFFLANSDGSGLSLFEEAQYRGVRAARAAWGYVGSMPSM
jgi:glycine/D-amino acid oxidase-like deaminating enzyme